MLGEKSFRRCKLVPIVAAFFCLVAFDIRSTTVIAPRFETLVDRAELIFTGRVTGQHSEWRNNQGRKSIVTLVTFAVQQVHKGHADATVTLQFLGGTLGDVTLDVTDMPKFKTGERSILFVEGNGTAVSPVIGFYQGRFSLQTNEAGRDVVFGHDNEPVADVGEIGRAKRLGPIQASRRALSHEEFSAKIHERLAATAQK